MIKKIIMIIMTALVLLACVHRNLTPEEKEEYKKARMRYEWGQRP